MQNLKKMKRELKSLENKIGEYCWYLKEQKENPTETNWQDRNLIHEQLRGMFSYKQFLEYRIDNKKGK